MDLSEQSAPNEMKSHPETAQDTGTDSDTEIPPAFAGHHLHVGPAPSHRPILSLPDLLALFSMSFSYGFCFNALNNVVIPKEIERLTHSRQSMWVGLVMATGAISQLSTPIVGSWSDRAGSRAPYLIYGTFIMIVGVGLFLALQTVGSLLLLFAAHIVTTVGLSVQYAMITALLNDFVSEEQTGKGSGAMAILAILGSGAGYMMFALDVSLLYSFCSYILVAIICLGITVTAIPTPNHSAQLAALVNNTAAAPTGTDSSTSGKTSTTNKEGTHHSNKKLSSAAANASRRWSQFLESILGPLTLPSPWQYPDFFFACAGRAFFNSGLAGQVFLVYYLRDVIGAAKPVQVSSIVAVMALLGGVLGALPAGMLSDRYGKKPLIYASIAICMMSLAAFMTVRDISTLHLVGFLYGIGNIAYLSVDYALGVQALPRKRGVPIDAAKDLGVFAMSATVGQLLGQVVYGSILDQHGSKTETGTQYSWIGFLLIYTIGALCFFASGVLTSLIKSVK